jgi:hypothetical protein
MPSKDIFRRVSAKQKLATFLWGHLTFIRFDESLAWSGENLKRRKAEHIFIDRSGKPYKVPFPSWSWLGWKGQPFFFPDPAGMPKYELEFFRLDIYGRVIPLLPDLSWSEYQTVRDTSRTTTSNDGNRNIEDNTIEHSVHIQSLASPHKAQKGFQFREFQN